MVLASLLTAVAIGAGHALTPGHGKTLMAAYLVGSRGTAVHAVGLGLSVAVSHTLGIFALALIIVGAGSVLPPDVVYRVTPVIAGASIVLIGGWMLIGELRRRRAAGAHAQGQAGGRSTGTGTVTGTSTLTESSTSTGSRTPMPIPTITGIRASTPTRTGTRIRASPSMVTRIRSTTTTAANTISPASTATAASGTAMSRRPAAP